MMMKMLAEGGLSAVTDSVRLADEDNPNGYFEFEPVKKLSEGQDQWLDGASGKIVKVISALLEHLPAQHRYKVLFMDREIKEILASQQKMLHRRGEAPGSSDTEMETQFREHLRLTKYWLARQPNMDVLYVDYNQLVAEPGGLRPEDRRFHRSSRGRVAHAERPQRETLPESRAEALILEAVPGPEHDRSGA